jgi:hypothetical protein
MRITRLEAKRKLSQTATTRTSRARLPAWQMADRSNAPSRRRCVEEREEGSGAVRFERARQLFVGFSVSA